MSLSSAIKRLDVLLDLHKYEELLESAYRLLYSSDEDRYSIYQYIIIAHLSLQEYEKALKLTQEALIEYPSSALFLYLLSEVHFAKGNYKDATLAINEALSIEPNSASYLAHAAKLLFMKKKFIEAKEQIEKALQLDATEASYHLLLARILYMLDGYKISCEIVESVLAKEPHNEEALDMKQEYCTATLKGKKKILQNILSLNPFNTLSQKDIEFIKWYHKYLPLSMIVFIILHYLIQSGKIVSSSMEMFSFFLFIILGTVGSKEFSINIPFIAIVLGINSYYKVGSNFLDMGDIISITILSIVFHYFFLGLSSIVEYRVWAGVKRVFRKKRE